MKAWHCAPDLIVAGETGAVRPVGDVEGLGEELRRIRDDSRGRAYWADKCRERIGQYSFAKATEGLGRACEAVAS